MININTTAIALHVFSSLSSTPTVPDLFAVHSLPFSLFSSLIRPVTPPLAHSAYVNTTLLNPIPVVHPYCPVIPPLTNDGQCYAPSRRKELHETCRNYVSAESSTLTFDYYSHNPRFLPPLPPRTLFQKRTFADKVKRAIWKGRQNIKQATIKLTDIVEILKENLKQYADHAMETLDSNPRVFPLVTFRESSLYFFVLSFTYLDYTVLGLILHGSTLQLLHGIKCKSIRIGHISRDVALSAKTKITSGARASISICEYSVTRSSIAI